MIVAVRKRLAQRHAAPAAAGAGCVHRQGQRGSTACAAACGRQRRQASGVSLRRIVAHAPGLGLDVTGRADRAGCARYPLHHVDAQGLQRLDLDRVADQQAHLADAEVVQHVGGTPVIARDRWAGRACGWPAPRRDWLPQAQSRGILLTRSMPASFCPPKTPKPRLKVNQ